jgi:hypothetical protein
MKQSGWVRYSSRKKEPALESAFASSVCTASVSWRIARTGLHFRIVAFLAVALAGLFSRKIPVFQLGVTP